MSESPQGSEFTRKLGPTVLMFVVTAGSTTFFAVGLWANRWDVAAGGGVTTLADRIAPLLTVVGALATVAMALILAGGHVHVDDERLYWPMSPLPSRRTIPWSRVASWTREADDVFVLRMNDRTEKKLRAGDLEDVNGFSEALGRYLGPPQRAHN